ncbi:hypothetical protein SMAC4_13242 [Sordaria macrospora]|nr:hypothetical protein SMAC4_13242 [Sordaria macrospora]
MVTILLSLRTTATSGHAGLNWHRPANNRSTRLHPSHEMPEERAGTRRA